MARVLDQQLSSGSEDHCSALQSPLESGPFFQNAQTEFKNQKFLGTSENAVKAQILVALIAYLLLQILRLSLKSEISVPDAMAVVGVMLLMKENISKLLGELPRIRRHPPPGQLVFDF